MCMKPFIPHAVLPFLLIISAYASDPIGQVTLPYQQFVDLTAKLEQEKAPAPPIAAVLTQANYLIEISDGKALVKVDWLAENHSNQWQSIAVAPSSLAIEPIGEAILAAQDEELCLLMPNQGQHRASARFPAPSGLGFAAKFPVLPATFMSISIRDQEQKSSYEIDGATSLRDASGQIKYLLPFTTREVILRKTDLDTAEKKPTVWNLSSSALVSYEAGWLKYEILISATPESGDGTELQLGFANAPQRIEITSEDLLEHEKNKTGVLMRWASRQKGERNILLRYRTQINSEESRWNLLMPKSDVGSTIVLAIPQGVEVSGQGWQQNPNLAHFPLWLREKAKDQKMILHHSEPSELTVKWLPRVETASVTIREAKISTRIVADGSQLTQANYYLEHTANGSVRWILPKDMSLLEASVNGMRSNPIDREGTLEFELPCPNANKPVLVAFSYTGTSKALDRVAGGLVLETPSTELFAHQIDWGITLPDGTKFDALESNAESAPAPPNSSSSSAWLRRLLTRGEPLRAEIFYRTSNSEN